MNVRRLSRAGAVLATVQFAAIDVADAAPLGKRQCVAAHEAGQDLRRSGHVREAVERFEACSARVCPAMVRSDCARRLGEARRAVPTIIFVAKDSRGNLVRDAKVAMDGAPIASSLDGSPIQVDAGEHMFELVAEGFVPVSRRLVISEGAKRHEPIVFEDPKPAPPPAPSPPPAAATTTGSATAAKEAAADGTVLRTGAIVGAGLGVVSVVVGVTFGVLAKTTYDDGLEEHCRGQNRFACDEKGVAAWESAEDQKIVSTITLLSGAALLAAGVVVYLAAPRGAERTATLRPMRSGVRLEW